MCSSAPTPTCMPRPEASSTDKPFEELVRQVCSRVFHWHLATAYPGARHQGAEDPYAEQVNRFLVSQKNTDLAKLVALAMMGRNFGFDPGAFARVARLTHPKAAIVAILMENERLKWELEEGLRLAASAGFNLDEEPGANEDALN